MREYGFTQAERNTYFDQQRVYSSFGRDTLNDFIVLHVYSPDSTSADNANLLGTKILSLGLSSLFKSFREIPTILLMNWAFGNGLMQFGVFRCRG